MYIIKLGKNIWLCDWGDVVVYRINDSTKMFKTRKEAQEAFWKVVPKWPTQDITKVRIQLIDDKFNILEEYVIGEV